MPNIIKSKIKHSDKFNDAVIIKYRFIRAISLITDESINIGMVIDNPADESPIIKLINDIETLNKLFPIFDLAHAYNCLDLVKTRYKLKKVQNVEMGISKTIFLSNIKIHTEYEMSHRTKSIEEILYNKYLTYSKTQKTMMTLYKTYFFKDWFLKNKVDKSMVIKGESEYITYALIPHKRAFSDKRKKIASYSSTVVEL